MMNYRGILILMCLILNYGAYAQQKGDFAKVMSCFKKGIGISYMTPLETDNSGVRAGFHLGFAPQIKLENNFYIKPEIAFSLKGGRADYNPNNLGVFDGEITYRTSYLELPLVAGYQLSEKFSVELGVFGAVPLTTRFDFDGQFINGLGEFDEDAIHDFDFGPVVGVKFGPVGVRYYYGLPEIANSTVAAAFLGDARQQTIQIYFQRNRFRNF